MNTTRQIRRIGPLVMTALAALTLAAAEQPVVGLFDPATGHTNTTGFQNVYDGALALLPAYDPAATNSFAAGEFNFGLAPAWKSETAAGTTPYVDLAGDYFFTKNVGVGADAVLFGNGQGSDTLDTVSLGPVVRTIRGNVALYFRADAGRDFNLKHWQAEFGPGICYRGALGKIQTETFIETRYLIWGGRNNENGWLTCAGVKFPGLF